MSQQIVYFDNPITINQINTNVNSLVNSTTVHTVQRTDTDYVKTFMTGTLGQYYQVKMIGAVAGQVNPESDFTYSYGYQSVVFTGAYQSNLVGISVTGSYNPSAQMINSVNAFDETVASTVVPFSTGTYFYAGSLGKPYASAVLGAMVDRGIIRLNDPIIKYFPDWRYMKVVQQKFFSNGSQVLACTGLQGSYPSVVNISTGTIDPAVQVVQLTDGRTGTINSFLTPVGGTGGAASLAGAGYASLQNFIIKVDRADLPAWKQPYCSTGSSSTGAYPYFLTSVPDQYKFPYYLEVQPIQVQDIKTYGTVQMAFSHQLGLGLANVANQNIQLAMRDKGVMWSNVNTWLQPANGNTQYSSSNGITFFNTNYASANPYYPGGTGGYTLNVWANEIVQAGLLSTHPGKVWEYDTSLAFGMAVCEVAYKQYYNLPVIKPFWQIARELVDIPLGIDGMVFNKYTQMGDAIAQRAVRDKMVPITSTAGAVQQSITSNAIGSSAIWNTSLGIHDIGASLLNITIWNLEAFKRFAYMLANYGVAKNGTRVLSKSFVKLMCETDFLPANLNMYWQNEQPKEFLATRNATPGVLATYNNIAFGLGGLVGHARPGKTLTTVTDYPAGWYHWAGSFGTEIWVNPSEGKYIVVFYKHNPGSEPTTGTSGSGIYFTAPTYFNNNYIPASYETYGFDVFNSTYTY